MGEVVKLGNSVVVDQELISEVWCALHELSDKSFLDRALSEFQESQDHARSLSRVLAMKMLQQECDLSKHIQSLDYLNEWITATEGDINV
tara:strand:+ start:1691 stop:1960 length:270 start_codon:yes stop_codon:yes gene_type:complete